LISHLDPDTHEQLWLRRGAAHSDKNSPPGMRREAERPLHDRLRRTRSRWRHLRDGSV